MVYVDEKRVEGGSDGGGRRGAQERQGTRHERDTSTATKGKEG